MKTEDYDQLLAEIRDARQAVRIRQAQLSSSIWYLEALLKRLDEEEHRIAQEALASTHSANRTLVVGE